MNIFHDLEGMRTDTLSCSDVCQWHYRITMEHVKVIKLWLTSGKLRKKLPVDDIV